MSRRDYDDDDDRDRDRDRDRGRARDPDRDRDRDRESGRGRSRADDEYDDRGPRRSAAGKPGSGLVLTAAITTLAAGGFILLYGLFTVLDGFGWLSLAREPEFPFGGGPGFRDFERAVAREFGGVFGNTPGKMRFLGIMQIVNGFLGLALGGLAVAGGIGLMVKKRWGRTLALIATFIGCGLALLLIVGLVAAFGVYGAGGTVVFSILIFLMVAALVVINLITLFKPETKRVLA
jgi:hypothetical protein